MGMDMSGMITVRICMIDTAMYENDVGGNSESRGRRQRYVHTVTLFTSLHFYCN